MDVSDQGEKVVSSSQRIDLYRFGTNGLCVVAVIEILAYQVSCFLMTADMPCLPLLNSRWMWLSMRTQAKTEHFPACMFSLNRSRKRSLSW